jgi:hypothetical protein
METIEKAKDDQKGKALKNLNLTNLTLKIPTLNGSSITLEAANGCGVSFFVCNFERQQLHFGAIFGFCFGLYFVTTK